MKTRVYFCQGLGRSQTPLKLSTHTLSLSFTYTHTSHMNWKIDSKTCFFLRLTSVKLKLSGSDRWNHLFTGGIVSSVASDRTSCWLEIAASPLRAWDSCGQPGRRLSRHPRTSEQLKCLRWFLQDSKFLHVSACVSRAPWIFIHLHWPPFVWIIIYLFIFRIFISPCRRYESYLYDIYADALYQCKYLLACI